MEILGYFLFLCMGLTLGLFGAGGSILSIPIITYIFQMPVLISTTYSLFIVGSSAFFGILRYREEIAFKEALLFAIPSLTSISLTRMYVLPLLPEIIWGFDRDTLLMLLLVIMMLFASYLMIKDHIIEHNGDDINHATRIKIICIGAFLGLVMGLIGAGGGFLITSTLVLLLGIEMKRAVATSLFIVMLNSAFGFMADQHHFDISQYKKLLIFTSIALFGMWLSTDLNLKFSGSQLKKGFGWFIATIATLIAIKEFYF